MSDDDDPDSNRDATDSPRDDGHAARDDGDAGADAAGGRENGDVPLSDLAAETNRRREAPADDLFETAFTEVDVGDVDEETLWEDVLPHDDGDADDGSDPDVAEAPENPAGGTAMVDTERVETPGDRDVRVVPDRVCHNCKFFGAPPELHCTHEGTEIREVIDVGHFQVVDCPVVADNDEFDLGEME